MRTWALHGFAVFVWGLFWVGSAVNAGGAPRETEAVEGLGAAAGPSLFRGSGGEEGMGEEPGTPLVLAQSAKDPFADDIGDEQEGEIISDPMEPLNRGFFEFNDRLYFWFFKPVAIGYKTVIPEPLRVSIRNAFSNLRMPMRALNCFFQGKMKGAGIEISRFVINSTLGVFGLGDPAKKVFYLEAYEEDFGQTLGVHGVPPGAYIDCPLLGPLNVRDAVGFAVDAFTDPLSWIVTPWKTWFAVRGGEWINGVSLTIGEYESLKRAAIDPYVSLRDAYYQYRENEIRE